MKAKIPLIARILLGIIFFGAGLMGLLTPTPPMDTIPETLGRSWAVFFRRVIL